jgi:hypothetical protein
MSRLKHIVKDNPGEALVVSAGLVVGILPGSIALTLLTLGGVKLKENGRLKEYSKEVVKFFKK